MNKIVNILILIIGFASLGSIIWALLTQLHKEKTVNVIKPCYDCENGVCKEASNSYPCKSNQFSDKNCKDSCVKGKPCYECENGVCKEASNSYPCKPNQFTDNNCRGCPSSKPCYECSNGVCKQASNSSPCKTNQYRDNKCENSCSKSQCYECNDGKCTKAGNGPCSQGQFEDPQCKSSCKPLVVQPLDNNGNPVDWWFMYAFPAGNNGGYLYMDSSTQANGFSYELYENPGLPAGEQSALFNTMGQIYSNGTDTNNGYMIWNDSGAVNTGSDLGAHEKGACMYDQDGGWLLNHTCDQYPADQPTSNQSSSVYSYVGNPFFQHFFCSSFKNSSQQPLQDWLGSLCKIINLGFKKNGVKLASWVYNEYPNSDLATWANSLTYISKSYSPYPQVGDSPFVNVYRKPITTMDINNKKPWSIETKNGETMILMAKSSYWFHDIFYDLYVKYLNEEYGDGNGIDTIVQNWWKTFLSPVYCRGEIPPDNWRSNMFPMNRGQPFPSSMEMVIKLVDPKYPAFTWDTSRDHSKWIIPSPEYAEKAKYMVGFTGLNHTGAPCPGSHNDDPDTCTNDVYNAMCKAERKGWACGGPTGELCKNENGEDCCKDPNQNWKGKISYGTSPDEIYETNLSANCSQWLRGGMMISFSNENLYRALNSVISEKCGCDDSKLPKMYWTDKKTYLTSEFNPREFIWNYKTDNNNPDQIEKLMQKRTCYGRDCGLANQGACMDFINTEDPSGQSVQMMCNPYFPTEVGGVGNYDGVEPKYNISGDPSNNNFPTDSPNKWKFITRPCSNMPQLSDVQWLNSNGYGQGKKQLKYNYTNDCTENLWNKITDPKDYPQPEVLKHYCS